MSGAVEQAQEKSITVGNLFTDIRGYESSAARGDVVKLTYQFGKINEVGGIRFAQISCLIIKDVQRRGAGRIIYVVTGKETEFLYCEFLLQASPGY